MKSLKIINLAAGLLAVPKGDVIEKYKLRWQLKNNTDLILIW